MKVLEDVEKLSARPLPPSHLFLVATLAVCFRLNVCDEQIRRSTYFRMFARSDGRSKADKAQEVGYLVTVSHCVNIISPPPESNQNFLVN